jgi:hypothetical protein
MKRQRQLSNQNPLIENKVSRPLWRRTVLSGFALTCLVLSPTSRAVNPPPDGGYANQNTAEGEDALFSLSSGTSGNTAIGFDALYSTTSGWYNTAIGLNALYSNIDGYSNTASGALALYSNTGGIYNTASGIAALGFNTTGNSNTAIGYNALYFNSTAKNNTAIGYNALSFSGTGTNNTAVGTQALLGSTGNHNIALGYQAGINLQTGNDDIYIDAHGAKGESNAIRLGRLGVQKNTYIVGISGSVVAGGVGVIIDSDGRLGTSTSSARFKEAIKPMAKASEALLSLEPVTFRYKKDLDPNGIPQFGLVAEQVAKVDPDLVARDQQGKPYTVRYEAVNAMLLNEFLKEHRKVEALEATVAKLQSTIEKVSARQEAQDSAPRLVENR